MRLSDLRDKTVCTSDGEKLGRVHEVHCDGGRLVALMVGAGSWIERMTAKRKGRRIAWEDVQSVGDKVITVGPPKASASRTRRGTPRPSARRSRR